MRPGTQPHAIDIGERSGARPDLVGLDAEALEHAHVMIAQGRRALRIEGETLAVLEAASGEENRQVFGGMGAAES